MDLVLPLLGSSLGTKFVTGPKQAILDIHRLSTIQVKAKVYEFIVDFNLNCIVVTGEM